MMECDLMNENSDSGGRKRQQQTPLGWHKALFIGGAALALPLGLSFGGALAPATKVAATEEIAPAADTPPPATAAAGGYQLDAVSFHPEVSLTTTGSLGVNGGIDTPRGVVSVWLKGSFGTQAAPGNDANWQLYNIDAFSNLGGASSENVAGLNFAFDRASTIPTLRMNLHDAFTTLLPANGHAAQAFLAAAATNATWHHYLWVWDTGQATGQKRNLLYIDGVIAAQGINDVGATAAFSVALNSILGFGINVNAGNGSYGAFDIAQLFIDTHTPGLIAAGNTLTVPIANFVSGTGADARPVDFGATCAAPTGSQADLCLVGDKTAFVANRGTASGALALRAPVLTVPTTTPRLYTAAVGPAGAPDARPYNQWVAAGHIAGQTTTTGSLTLSNNGNPIVAGDLLIATIHLVDTSRYADRAIATPPGWTAITGSPLAANGAGGYGTNSAVFWRIATAADATASGADWAGPPVAWTANTVPLRSGTWELLLYKQAGRVEASAIQANAPSSAPPAPGVTPTSQQTTLLSLFFIYDASNAKLTYPPVSQDLRFKRAGASGTIGYVMASDEGLCGTGAAVPRLASQGAAIPTVAASLILAP